MEHNGFHSLFCNFYLDCGPPCFHVSHIQKQEYQQLFLGILPHEHWIVRALDVLQYPTGGSETPCPQRMWGWTFVSVVGIHCTQQGSPTSPTITYIMDYRNRKWPLRGSSIRSASYKTARWLYMAINWVVFRVVGGIGGFMRTIWSWSAVPL